MKLDSNIWELSYLYPGKIIDKNNEHLIIEQLNSNDVEDFFKVFSVKEHFDKEILNKYGIRPKELASTVWFRTKIVNLLNGK